MARPFRQQSADTPIHEQVRELARKAHTDRMAAIGVVFSQVGYGKARLQTVPGMDPWSGYQGTDGPPTRYLGLPFRVSDDLSSRHPSAVVTLDLVPGGSAEAKQFRASQGFHSVNRTFHKSRWRMGYPDGVPGTPEYEPAPRICNQCDSTESRCRCGPEPLRVTVKGLMDRPTIEVLAEGLTLPQMCDLVSAWATANPGEALGQAMMQAVEQHGRFE